MEVYSGVNKFPSLREFCLYAIAKGLDALLFESIREEDYRALLYILGPGQYLSGHDLEDLIAIVSKRHDSRYQINRLRHYFDGSLRTGHLYALLHQDLRSVSLVKCGHLVTSTFLARLATRTPPLYKLELADLSKTVTKQSIMQLVASCGKSLFYLTLSNCQRVDGDVIGTIAEHCSRLEALNLSACPSVKPSHLLPLCNAPLRDSLHSVDVSLVDIDEHFLREMLSHFPKLQVLNLRESCCDFTVNPVIMGLAEDDVAAPLRKIDLSVSDIDDLALGRLLSRFPSVCDLVLMDCSNLSYISLDSLGGLERVNSLTLSSGIQHADAWELWISNFHLYRPSMHALTTLVLRGTQASVPCAPVDLQALNATCPDLTELDISDLPVSASSLGGLGSNPFLPDLRRLTLEGIPGERTVVGDVNLLLDALPSSLRSVSLSLRSVPMSALYHSTAQWPSMLDTLRIRDDDGLLGHVIELLHRCERLVELAVTMKPIHLNTKLLDAFKNVNISIDMVQL